MIFLRPSPFALAMTNQPMKKILFTIVICMMTGAVFAKTTYIYNNKRMNYVKIEGLHKEDLKVCQPTQPVTVSEAKMRDILKAIKFSRSFILKENIEDASVFTEREVNFFAPKVIEALSQATEKDRVVMSYITKDPLFIMRNDRLTIAILWACGDDLHMRFEKLLAKLTGDYDKRSDYSKIISQSRGLRIGLELGDGQAYGKTTDELVINLNYDFNEPPPAPPVAAEPAKGKGKEAAAVVSNQPPKTTKERLKELDDLKLDGLITEKEYKLKRRAIIEGL